MDGGKRKKGVPRPHAGLKQVSLEAVDTNPFECMPVPLHTCTHTTLSFDLSLERRISNAYLHGQYLCYVSLANCLIYSQSLPEYIILFRC